MCLSYKYDYGFKEPLIYKLYVLIIFTLVTLINWQKCLIQCSTFIWHIETFACKMFSTLYLWG